MSEYVTEVSEGDFRSNYASVQHAGASGLLGEMVRSMPAPCFSR